jgi:pimeloyl-ACP methyl ester carboxylesterase
VSGARTLRHGKIRLALHELRAGAGRPLLLLHGLGERSPEAVPEELAAWPGPVFALDFTGHGESTVPAGGGYSCEVLMADADAALRELGEATLVGRGLGAYVGLLLAGARPRSVRGVILRDGIGMAGGGSRPGSPSLARVDTDAKGPPDPFALAELSRDMRPPDYATTYAVQALEMSGLARPISVCCCERPEWLRAVVEEPGVVTTTVTEALAHYAGGDPE